MLLILFIVVEDSVGVGVVIDVAGVVGVGVDVAVVDCIQSWAPKAPLRRCAPAYRLPPRVRRRAAPRWLGRSLGAGGCAGVARSADRRADLGAFCLLGSSKKMKYIFRLFRSLDVLMLQEAHGTAEDFELKWALLRRQFL